MKNSQQRNIIRRQQVLQQTGEQTTIRNIFPIATVNGAGHMIEQAKRGRDMRMDFQNPNGVMECNPDNDI